MLRYLLSRGFYSLVTLFVMVTLMFFMFRLLPGDPSATVIGPSMDPASQAAMRARFGLDLPVAKQYLVYIENLSKLDFGLSFRTSEPVWDLIRGRLTNTLVLILPSMIVAYAIGTILGALAAWHRGSKIEATVVVAATAFQSAPLFWLGMLAIGFFSINLGLFPAGHIVSAGAYPEQTWQMYFSLDFLHHLALPFVVNTLYQLCFPLLLMRSTMISMIGEDFIEFARMKGLSERRVLYGHAMRNSLLPLATTLPMILGWAVAGSVVIETVFSWPGLGLLMVEGVTQSDYPTVQAAFFLIAVLTIAGTFAADMIYGFLDPRISY